MTEPYLDSVPLCPMRWQYDAVSIAAGTVPKEEYCNRPATILRLIHGDPVLVCTECASVLDEKPYADDPS